MSFKKSDFVKTNYRAREEGVKTYQALYLKTAIVNINIKIITRHEFRKMMRKLKNVLALNHKCLT